MIPTLILSLTRLVLYVLSSCSSCSKLRLFFVFVESTHVWSVATGCWPWRVSAALSLFREDRYRLVSVVRSLTWSTAKRYASIARLGQCSPINKARQMRVSPIYKNHPLRNFEISSSDIQTLCLFIWLYLGMSWCRLQSLCCWVWSLEMGKRRWKRRIEWAKNRKAHEEGV